MGNAEPTALDLGSCLCGKEFEDFLLESADATADELLFAPGRGGTDADGGEGRLLDDLSVESFQDLLAVRVFGRLLSRAAALPGTCLDPSRWPV